MRNRIFIIIAITGLSALILYWPKTDNTVKKNEGPIVTASFYPLYYLAKEIMGSRGQVYNLTPAGAEPHDYELTTKDRMRIENSDLIVLNGGMLEPWAGNISSLVPGAKVLIAGDGLMFENDPHVWLSPDNMTKIAEKITKELIEIDPAGTNIYRSNSSNLISLLYKLDVNFREGLKICEKTEIITSHAAFAYLARRYGFTQISISGLSPEAEPSARDLSEVARIAKEKNIRYVFFESLVSPKLAETVASEIGAKTLVLNPLEGLSDDELASGKNYFTEMMNNLTNLRTALICR